MKYNVAIVDDHKIFREGFKLVLNSFDTINNIYEATNGKEFLEMLEKSKPDLVFLDINMPVMDGFEATKKALKLNSKLKIIAITSFDYIEYVNNMLMAGVEGYLLKDTDYEEIELAIESVMNDKNYFSTRVLESLTKNTLRSQDEGKRMVINLPELTKRETEILRMICKGHSKNDIAEKLFISVRTVEKHKENIMMKTNTNNSVNLVLFALKNNLAKV
jgi:DNA-binding NarL/FixJ family response regulator